MDNDGNSADLLHLGLNIFKGAYNRTEKYVKKPSNRTRKLKNYLP